MPGTPDPQAAVVGWERSGNHGSSHVRSAALFCSPVRGFICGNTEMTWWRGCGYFPGGQGVAGSNPAVPTVFRTLVPRNGNENCHDHSHLTGREEPNIHDGGLQS